METAIVSIICVVLIVVGGMTLSQGFLTSADTTSSALEEQGARDKEIMSTELTPQTTTVNETGTKIWLTLENTGKTKLSDFANWDIIVQYFDAGDDYHTTWLPNQSGNLSDNQWRVSGIYLDADPETFDPNILNPGENILIEAQVSPAVGTDTTNMIVASTPNGIPVSVYFVN